MRRVARTLLPSLLFVAILGCAHAPVMEPSSKHNPCPHGQADVVCIDPISLAPTPEPATVTSGKYIHFFVSGGRGPLKITFEAGTPVEDEGHVGDHAWAKAKKVSSEEKHKYTIELDGKKLDPTLIIYP